MELGDTIRIALETNGRGYLGFLVDLPGAFVRGETEGEALSKVNSEALAYLRWLGIAKKTSKLSVRAVQEHRCRLMIEDADSEILLNEDKRSMGKDEFRLLVDLALYSGRTFLALYSKARFKDWVDPSRVRKTFYGENKKTIREIFEHVRRTQYYYLSRTGANFDKSEHEKFMNVRKFCLTKISELFKTYDNSRIFTPLNRFGEIENELWTIKKVLRRFIWHDRIHGKAITRILEKQRQLGMITAYSDPFFFELRSNAVHTQWYSR